MAHVVYTNVNGTSETMGTLFKGTKFFFSQRVPSRAHYIEQVKVRPFRHGYHLITNFAERCSDKRG